MADIKALEHPTLKVPYENLNKRFRSAQKVIEREMTHVMSAVDAAEKVVSAPTGGEDANPEAEAAAAAAAATQLDAALARLESFQSRSNEAVKAEMDAAANCKHRLEHLRGGVDAGQDAASNPAAQAVWRKTRVDRMLVEHFLRSGFYNSAIRLAQAAGITELTNINLFLVAKEVEESLSAKDTSKCLSWCHDNKSKMRKMKSTLEFNLRLQEFVELVRAGQKMEAVRHARKHLSSSAASVDSDNLSTVQRAMALLAFCPSASSSSSSSSSSPPSSLHPVYRDLFSKERWQRLIEQFRAENYRLFQLSTQSVFSVALQAGLSSLKTQRCSSKKRPAVAAASSSDEPNGATEGEATTMETNGNDSSPKGAGPVDRNSECPVCQEPLHQLAHQLPYAHCSQSRLICYISGHPLNEHNQPLMLPNGFVYGEEALAKMAVENEGQIICPRTKEIYAFDQAEKVYVM